MFSSQSTDAATGMVEILDQVFILLRRQAQSIMEASPQVRMLDFYTLSAVSVWLMHGSRGMHSTTSSANTNDKHLNQHATREAAG